MCICVDAASSDWWDSGDGIAKVTTHWRLLTTVGIRRRVVSTVGRLLAADGTQLVTWLRLSHSLPSPGLASRCKWDPQRTSTKCWSVGHPCRQLKVLAGARDCLVERQVTIHVRLHIYTVTSAIVMLPQRLYCVLVYVYAPSATCQRRVPYTGWPPKNCTFPFAWC